MSGCLLCLPTVSMAEPVVVNADVDPGTIASAVSRALKKMKEEGESDST